MNDAKIYYGYIIIFFAFIIMSVQWAVIYSFGVFLKPLVAEFGWSRAVTSGAFSISSIIGGLVAIYMGSLNDRLGPRFVMSLCGFLLGIGCMLVSRTETILHFYLSFGIIIGISMGGQFTPLMSTVVRWFFARRGVMSGIVVSGVGVGALLGPQLANLLLFHYGWRTAYTIIGAMALVIIMASAQLLKREPPKLHPMDSSVLSEKRTAPENIKEGATLLQASCNYQFWLYVLTGFCYGYALFSLTVHIMAHAIDKGISPTLAVSILSTFGGLSIMGKVIFGRVLDRIGSKNTVIVGFSMISIAFVCLIMAQGSYAIFTGAGIFGFFYGAITVSMSPMTAVLFGLKSHGLILGVYGTSVTLGGALGPYFTGCIYDHSGSYKVAFIACTVVCVLGIVSAAKIKQMRITLATQL
jgi:OFA family oxalate/formate antiporter-like MFS transporter